MRGDRCKSAGCLPHARARYHLLQRECIRAAGDQEGDSQCAVLGSARCSSGSRARADAAGGRRDPDAAHLAVSRPVPVLDALEPAGGGLTGRTLLTEKADPCSVVCSLPRVSVKGTPTRSRTRPATRFWTRSWQTTRTGGSYARSLSRPACALSQERSRQSPT